MTTTEMTGERLGQAAADATAEEAARASGGEAPAATGSAVSGEVVAAPRFDTKVVVVLGEGLAAWQELNVTAFLMSGIATSAADLTGEAYRDGDGVTYLPMLREPVLVLTGSAELLRKARATAARQDVVVSIYTRELFATGHDDANRAAVAAVASADLDLVGIAVRGPRNAVDRVVKGARFHD